MKRNATVLLSIVGITMVMFSALLVVRADSTFRDIASQTKPVPILGTVRDGLISTRVAGRIELSWVPGETLRWRGSSQMVTSVHRKVGDELSGGDAIFDVDNSTIRYFPSAVPLYRDIASNQSGSDVEAVASYLRILDYIDSEASLRRQIQQFQAQNGFPERDGVFRPGYVIWGTQSTFQVGSMLGLGTQLATGEQILQSTPSIERLRVVNAAGIPIELGRVAGIASLSFDSGESIDVVVNEGRFNWEIIADKLVFIDALRNEPDSVEVLITFESRESFVMVPSSALIVDQSGKTCVATLKSEGLEYHVVAVKEDSNGTAYLDSGDDLVGETIQFNPWVLGDVASCHSSQ